MRRVGLLACVLAVPGCFAPGDLRDQMQDDLPPGRCRDTDPDNCASSTGSTGGGVTSGAASTTGEPADACSGAQACMGAQACAAPWDADAEARGPFECRFACIPTLDETTWCADDASCCDAAATCTARGYCVTEPGSTGAGSSTGGGSSTSGGSSTGAGSSTSEGSSTGG